MNNNIIYRDLSPSQGDHRGSLYISSIVSIGSIPLGGSNPIRIQSMTNTDTLDTKASVAQCIRIIEAGADYVRLTTQSIKEAENLEVIKKNLRKAGFETPLIADVHFNPSVAEVAARIADKVRINPGNYTDKRASFQKNKLSENEYEAELERIHSRILPLINICRSHETAIRIGVNHGSLSDRIMTKYGNTPLGMVWSAIEFIRILKAENFNSLVLSMKSSDTAVMIDATRLLVKMMADEGVAYPVHLGVTEAGEGEDGRVRSAAGIGTLLSEGIGDTIRVSLSEDPENEIPVARRIVEYLPRNISAASPAQKIAYNNFPEKPSPFSSVTGPMVIADMTSHRELISGAFSEAGYLKDSVTGAFTSTDGTADIILTGDCPPSVPGNIRLVLPFRLWTKHKSNPDCFPLFSIDTYAEATEKSDKLNFILVGGETPIIGLKSLPRNSVMFIFRFEPDKDMFAADIFLNEIPEKDDPLNVIINPLFRENDIEDLQIKAAAVTGRFVNAKNLSGICITNKGKINPGLVNSLSFSILQCTGARITRTQYISCPTCGRTKFNLQDAVKKVKEATGHLKGLKIAVMGCIVNGPGEMAGADWGYVGASSGKVHIYKGLVPVRKNVPEDKAIEVFLELIEEDQTLK
jgi:(E)-4-hydroxy-3-methylbut-2-enyl-diphosphate synthase